MFVGRVPGLCQCLGNGGLSVTAGPPSIPEGLRELGGTGDGGWRPRETQKEGSSIPRLEGPGTRTPLRYAPVPGSARVLVPGQATWVSTQPFCPLRRGRQEWLVCASPAQRGRGEGAAGLLPALWERTGGWCGK